VYNYFVISFQGATTIFAYLLENVKGYSVERHAEMLELMGSTFIDEHHDIQMALAFWRQSVDLREAEGVAKNELGYSPLYSILPEGVEGNLLLFNYYSKL